MHYEQILASLKTKYKHLGLSEKILKVYAKKISKTVEKEDDISKAIEDVADDLALLQSISDSNRTKMEELENQIKELSNKKETKKETSDDKKTKEGSEIEKPAWVDEILNKVESQNKIIEELQSVNRKETAKEKFISKAKEMEVSEVFYKSHTDKEFESDEELTSFIESLKSDETAYKQSLTNENLKNHDTNSFDGKKMENEEVSPDVQAFIDSDLNEKDS